MPNTLTLPINHMIPVPPPFRDFHEDSNPSILIPTSTTRHGRLPVGDDGGLLHQALTSAQGWGDVRNLERIDKVGGPLQVSIHLP